jgi:hypothetical protein
MSGTKHYFTCELESDLNVRLHLDEEGDMFIAVERDNQLSYESGVLLTKEDAAEMAEILINYANS